MKQFNDWLALHITLVFGTMWMTYAFFFYGFLPLVFPKDEVTLLYWSNTVQLWSLPLLMVGTNLLGKKSEERAQQDHEMIKGEFAELKAMHKEKQDSDARRDAMLERILEAVGGDE